LTFTLRNLDFFTLRNLDLNLHTSDKKFLKVMWECNEPSSFSRLPTDELIQSPCTALPPHKTGELLIAV